jgi:hypothetical protein
VFIGLLLLLLFGTGVLYLGVELKFGNLDGNLAID